MPRKLSALLLLEIPAAAALLLLALSLPAPANERGRTEPPPDPIADSQSSTPLISHCPLSVVFTRMFRPPRSPWTRPAVFSIV